MDGVKEAAYKYAVKNAFEHVGKAQIGAVVGKVKALFPETDLKKVMPQINEAVLSTNKLSKEKLKEEYEKFTCEGWELVHVEKEKSLPELEWLAPGMKLITRVAPNPSGPMHFGHARPAVLTDEYVKKYGGKLTLRFDDTDPKIKVPVAGIEKEFMRDFEWLGIKFHETANASDHLLRYYEIIEKLIIGGNAYICTCDPEEWRKLIWESKPCLCRGKPVQEQITLWKKMLKHEIKEGNAVVRIKSDLNDPDPSTRDWWLAKIVDKPEHPNPKTKGKHVWASYNLASAVDDHDAGINFIIRGQEHRENEEKQKVLYKYFEWEYPHTLYHGKVSKLGEMTLSKSKIKDLMEKSGLERDDDPRLATIKAFRRRGFTPEALRKVILDCGISLKEVKISIDAFAAANKDVLGEAKEFPFFEDAILLEVNSVAAGEADCYGEKIIFKQGNVKLIVDKKELMKYANKKGTMVRLKKAFNAVIVSANEKGGKADFASYKKSELPILSWIKETANVEVLMDDGSTRKGTTAKNALNASGVVHFEGLGYANIEEKKEKLIKCVYAYN